ncbi:anti-sigma factor [Thermoleophilum album]|jgi:hypothetical protein|uniref:anti-sigma factor n=1 Tax=Thermoleophilum album TaxID=29539 RepID=UPI00237CCF2A|nr:anti-sigma factor [Thermoleophilum album]WDT94004.1 anti-sigma factor [Thermoleophilum album]
MSVADSDKEHAWVSETLAAWALGAVGERERELIDEHLAACDRCRAEADALLATTSALAEAVPPRTPSPALRERVLAEVRAEASLLRAARDTGHRAGSSSRRWRELFLPAARPLAIAGVLLAMLIVGFALGSVLDGDIAGESRRRVLAGRITDPALASRAWARATVDEHAVRIEVRGLPRPPANGVYEVWVQQPGSAPRPAEPLFVATHGAVEVPVRLGARDRVMITREPAGGSEQPTSPPLIVFEPTS